MILIKTALLGDGAVGKTTLRRRYIGSSFQSSYSMTIGADFSTYETRVGGYDVKFQIWDLAGQPRFKHVRTAFYSGVMGCIVVYDITRKETFDNTPLWIQEAFKHSGHGAVPVVLCANKIDLRLGNPHALKPKHGQLLAGEINGIIEKKGVQCGFLETSAKTGVNVDRAFNALGTNIIELKKKEL
ncbi:MAG: GTP-binding protein [Candidatus Odinarchaeota archaeon]